MGHNRAYAFRNYGKVHILCLRIGANLTSNAFDRNESRRFFSISNSNTEKPKFGSLFFPSLQMNCVCALEMMINLQWLSLMVEEIPSWLFFVFFQITSYSHQVRMCVQRPIHLILNTFLGQSRNCFVPWSNFDSNENKKNKNNDLKALFLIFTHCSHVFAFENKSINTQI